MQLLLPRVFSSEESTYLPSVHRVVFKLGAKNDIFMSLGFSCLQYRGVISKSLKRLSQTLIGSVGTSHLI